MKYHPKRTPYTSKHLRTALKKLDDSDKRHVLRNANNLSVWIDRLGPNGALEVLAAVGEYLCKTPPPSSEGAERDAGASSGPKFHKRMRRD